MLKITDNKHSLLKFVLIIVFSISLSLSCKPPCRGSVSKKINNTTNHIILVKYYYGGYYFPTDSFLLSPQQYIILDTVHNIAKYDASDSIIFIFDNVIFIRYLKLNGLGCNDTSINKRNPYCENNLNYVNVDKCNSELQYVITEQDFFIADSIR
mgnify:CR=1 FL=1